MAQTNLYVYLLVHLISRRLLYMKNNQIELDTKLLIKKLKIAEECIVNLATQIGELRGKYEFPYLLEESKKMLADGKVKEVSASWVQKKFKIGYSRASELADILNKKKK